MATIYPFSIYTSKGQVYPSKEDDELIVDLSWLGWEPELIKKQFDSVNHIIEQKTLYLPASEGQCYMLPDLSMYDLSDWNTNPITFREQTSMNILNNELVIDFSKIDSIDEYAFSRVQNLHSIEFIGKAKVHQSAEDEQLDLARATGLFMEIDNLTSVTNLDLSDYTYNYTENMFFRCYNLVDLDLKMSNYFYGSVMNMFADCSSLEEIPLSTMDLSHVTNADTLFGRTNCHTYPTLTNMDNVQNIQFMFQHCNGGNWTWNPNEYPNQGTIDVEISFAEGAAVSSFAENALILRSITINTTNMPGGSNQLIPMTSSDRDWLSQLKVYVPASVVSDWVALIKSTCDGDPDLEAIVDNMVEAISQ